METTKDEKLDNSLKETDPKIVFSCVNCKLSEKVDYKGIKPPFSRDLMLKEAAYVMKDPFSDPNKKQILVIGNDCSVCNRMVCISKDCGVFYKKTYCIECAKDHADTFPISLKNKFK